MADVGRPSKYDPAFVERVIEFMDEGYSLTAFAGEIGVARSTINEWMGVHDDFSEAVKIGKAKRGRFWEGRLVEMSKIGGEKGAVTAAIFGAKNADPEEWRDRQEVQHSGRVVSAIESVIVDPKASDPHSEGVRPSAEAEPL